MQANEQQEKSYSQTVGEVAAIGSVVLDTHTEREKAEKAAMQIN